MTFLRFSLLLINYMICTYSNNVVIDQREMNPSLMNPSMSYFMIYEAINQQETFEMARITYMQVKTKLL